MKIDICMKTRDGRAYANAYYDDGQVTILPGGKVSESFKGENDVYLLRHNRELIDEEGFIIKESVFSNPSIAAQFVNGNISNGYRVWKANGKDLGKYLEEMGIRKPRKK